MHSFVVAVANANNCGMMQSQVLILAACRAWAASDCESAPDEFLDILGVELDYLDDFISCTEQIISD
jgi:hypothetical protein